MCSVVGCESWRRTAQCFTLPEDPEIQRLWVEFVAESSEQRSEIAVCSEHFLEESFEKSINTECPQLKLSAVPSVRIKAEDVRGFGDIPQKGSSQQPDPKHFCVISSPSNQKHEDLTREAEDKDWSPTEALVVVVKEENIKLESEEDISHQEAVSRNHASSTTSKDGDEESVSEEDTDEDSDEDSEEDTKMPDHKDRHVKFYSKQLCDDCGCFYNPSKSHTCEHKLKPYACNMCGKRLRTKFALKSHSHIHDNSKMYNCKYCYAPFKTKQDKFIHQETHKEELNPFRCHSCPAAFNSFLDRREHLRTHPRARAHKCDKCGITFTRKHVLERHKVVHSGEKAFKCPVCERSFNQHGHLKSHMRLHTGEKPYECEYCDKAFNHNVSLKSHVQRYHSSKRPHETEDARGGDGTDCGEDLVNSQHAPDKVKDAQAEAFNLDRWSTGRPKGRPVKNPDGKLSPKRKRDVDKSLKRRQKSGGRSEEVRNSRWSFDLDEEVEKRSKRESRSSSTQLKNPVDADYIPGRKREMRHNHRGLRVRAKAKI